MVKQARAPAHFLGICSRLNADACADAASPWGSHRVVAERGFMSCATHPDLAICRCSEIIFDHLHYRRAPEVCKSMEQEDIVAPETTAA